MRDEIGTLFHEAPVPRMGVDPAAVLAGGRRRRRRRRLTAVVGSAAAALVLGAAGWTVLSGKSGGDGGTLPATSSSSPAEMGVGTVEVPLDGSPTGGVARVVVDEPGRTVGWQVVVDGAEVDAGEFQLPGSWGGGVAPTWADQPAAAGIVVGVLPSPVSAATAAWAGEPPGSPFRTAPVPGTAYDAFVSWDPDGRPGSLLTDVTWVSSDLAYGRLGTQLPAIAIDGVVGFVDPVADLVGVARDGELAMRRRVDADVDGLSVVTLRGDPVDDVGYRVTTLVVLPVGATLDEVTGTDVDALVVSGVRELTVFGPGGAPSVGSGVVIRRETDEELPGTGVDSLRWTDDSGTSHVTDLSDVG